MPEQFPQFDFSKKEDQEKFDASTPEIKEAVITQAQKEAYKMNEQKEKPPFLYHASQNKNIEEFELRAEGVRDPAEGPVVFATPNLALVTTFLVKTHDGWTNKGIFNDVVYMIISDEEKFRKLDRGGSIYKLPSNSFDFDLNKGMSENEWISREPVKPLEKLDIDSALDTMIDNSVQVYFVDKEFFAEFNRLRAKRDFDELLEMIHGIKSENEKIGKNFVKFK